MPPTVRANNVFTLQEAAGAAPTLAALQARIRQSQDCLQQIRPLIPSTLRAHVAAGPLGDDEWCLLVKSAAASTKLRQLLPSFLRRLNDSGVPIAHIRIKVQTPGR